MEEAEHLPRTPLGLRLASRVVGDNEPTGGPYGQYRFEAELDRRHALTVHVAVNVPKDDRLTGLDTLYVEDIVATGGTPFDFETTRPGSAYGVGVRIGTAATRDLLRRIASAVRHDFPGIVRVAGSRTTGARWLNRARRPDRGVDIEIGRDPSVAVDEEEASAVRGP